MLLVHDSHSSLTLSCLLFTFYLFRAFLKSFHVSKVSSQKNGREIGNRKSHLGVSLRRGGSLGGGFVLNRIRLPSRPTCLYWHRVLFEIILLQTPASYDFNYGKYVPTTFSTFRNISEALSCPSSRMHVCLFACIVPFPGPQALGSLQRVRNCGEGWILC